MGWQRNAAIADFEAEKDRCRRLAEDIERLKRERDEARNEDPEGADALEAEKEAHRKTLDDLGRVRRLLEAADDRADGQRRTIARLRNEKTAQSKIWSTRCRPRA